MESCLNRDRRFFVSCICGTIVCMSEHQKFEHSVFSPDEPFVALPGSQNGCEKCKNILKFLVTKEIDRHGIYLNFFLKEIL